MLPQFATAMQRVNDAVQANLSDVLVSIGGAPGIRGIFYQDYVVAEVGAAGMAASAPAVTVPTGDVPKAFSGVAVVIEGADGVTHWKIAEHHPDGAGMSVLLLERAA